MTRPGWTIVKQINGDGWSESILLGGSVEVTFECGHTQRMDLWSSRNCRECEFAAMTRATAPDRSGE